MLVPLLSEFGFRGGHFGKRNTIPAQLMGFFHTLGKKKYFSPFIKYFNEYS